MTAGLHNTAVKACVVRSDKTYVIKQRLEFTPQLLKCRLALHIVPGDAMDVCEHKVSRRRPDQPVSTGYDLERFDANDRY